MRDLHRVAIIDHLSHGGVSRVLLALITHMAAQHPETAFVYFVADRNITRDDLETVFAPFPNVSLRPIASPLGSAAEPVAQPERGALWRSVVGVLKAVPLLHRALLGAYTGIRRLMSPSPSAWWDYRMADDVVHELADFDIAYLGWPFFTEPVAIPIAVVGTFHDFHFKRFPEAYPAAQLGVAERETPEWLARCTTAVVSTRFIRDEIRSYYAEVAPPVEVIYLAPYGFHHPEPGSIGQAVSRLGITRPYALYSGGHSSHKNMARLIEAVGKLRRDGMAVQLVITGAGSDEVGRETDQPADGPIHAINRAIERSGLVRGEGYLPLGYVSNADVDALTAGADVVVSPSLYEAGCGPAMDAWQAGAPVAFSSIPPFLEQIERFGAQAWVFDPLDVDDIAEKIRSAIEQPARSKEMAAASLSAFAEYNWEDVAREYYRVFAEAAGKGPSEHMMKAVSREQASPRRQKTKGRAS